MDAWHPFIEEAAINPIRHVYQFHSLLCHLTLSWLLESTESIHACEITQRAYYIYEKLLFPE
jgi:hypothetical protein